MVQIITDEDVILDLINGQKEELRGLIFKALDDRKHDAYLHLKDPKTKTDTFLMKFTSTKNPGLALILTDDTAELKELLLGRPGLSAEFAAYLNKL